MFNIQINWKLFKESNFQIKIGIILLALISITFISIILTLIYKLFYSLYLKLISKKEVELKSQLNSSDLLNHSHLNKKRRTLEKDVKNFNFKLSKQKVNKFKFICEKNNLTMISVLDDFISNYSIKKGNSYV